MIKFATDTDGKNFHREVRKQKLVIFSHLTIFDFLPFQARTTIGFVYEITHLHAFQQYLEDLFETTNKC